MSVVEQGVPKHPAKWSKPILDEIRRILTEASPNHPLRLIDCCAGVGGIHDLHANGGYDTVGIELQPEWACQHPRTQVGDATDLSRFEDGSFDAGVVSFSYGTRMADHHDAKDPCKPCAGRGRVASEMEAGAGAGSPGEPCPKCGGLGLSKRNTYAHYLRAAGAEPVDSPTNTALQQWGPAYRETHTAIAKELMSKVDGLLIINVSNHIRDHVEQRVVEWFVYLFITLGCYLVEARRVGTRRFGHGANRDARVDGEMILVFRTPNAPTWA